MQTNQIKDLIDRYLSDNCTEAEKELVERSYIDYLPNNKVLREEEIAEDLEFIQANLPTAAPKYTLSLIKKLSLAAAIVIVVSGGLLYLNYRKSNIPSGLAINEQEQILPGTDKAILTLADGRKIILDKNASTLVLDSSAGIKIKKTAAGELIYEILNPSNNQLATNGFNIIETPRGSQYTVILQDGSRVWLNASSSLKYPVVFSGNQRKVDLAGEGYFEVAKNKDMPFVVHTRSQDVKVLGTHFNIDAYGSKDQVKTSLLEGKVEVSHGDQKVMMKPGDQVTSLQNSKHLKLESVENVAESIAWKNGLFLFNHEDLHDIMDKISRWYDVEVTYKDDFSNQYYSGTITKFGKVTDVLGIMELTGSVKFKIVGRRIMVMK